MAIKSNTIIQTDFGLFAVSYHEVADKGYVSFVYGDVTKGIPVIRIHSACLFGEAFHSLHCDCDHQLTETMRAISKRGSGAIIYSYAEGRGIGLQKKIEAMEIERTTGCDTVEAFKKLGFDKPDYRDHKAEVEVLNELDVALKIHSFSGNPNKRTALEEAGFEIIDELEIEPDTLSEIALKEKNVKKEKMGYTYKNS